MGQEEFMFISNCLLMSSSSSSICSLAMSSIASPGLSCHSAGVKVPEKCHVFFCHNSTQHALQYCMSIMIILTDSDSPSNMRGCDIFTMMIFAL